MRDDIPAALPLLIFASALAAVPLLVDRSIALAGSIALAALLGRFSRRAAALALFAAAGLAIGEVALRRSEVDSAAIARQAGSGFVVIEAPIDRDWSPRGEAAVLHTARFSAGGTEIRRQLTIYVRFEPPPIGMESTVRAEGFLRADARGRCSLSAKSPRLLGYVGSLSMWHPAAWNRALAIRLRRFANDYPEETAMIEALVLGRGERLSDETREQFKRGGTYHLLVFSGMQIALAAGLIALLLRWAGAPRASDWSLLAFAVVAPLFIGPTASVSRASSGIALYALSRIARRPTSFENLWCVAAIARLAVVPEDLADPSFHLTYAGAGALIFIGKPLARTRMRWLAYVIAAEIAIAPLTLHHFHQYALGGSLVTVAMTPIIFILLLVGIAFCATTWTPLLAVVAALNRLCEAMNAAAAPFSGFAMSPPAVLLSVAAASAICALALLRGRWRLAAVVASLALPSLFVLVQTHRLRTVRDPEAVFLDVGHGDAIVLRAGERTVLVDGGGRFGDVRFGESRLLPMLVDRGVRKIDAVVLTHVHPDHCGGLPAVVSHLDVSELWISTRAFRGDCAVRLLEASRRRRTPIRLLRDGYRRDFGSDLAADVMLASRYLRRARENNASVILRVSLGTRSLLLPGDIERDAEYDVSDRLRRTDILKVPHHGSRTSTTDALLDASGPRIAVISCGSHNLFGHPHPVVVERLATRRIRILRTDRHGTIELRVRGRIVTARTEIDTPR